MTSMPAVDRPEMPEGYGPGEGLDGTLPWTWAEQRLVAAHNYWVATSGPAGAPHVVPAWGVWVRRAFWFGSDPGAAKARNLTREPRVAVHLESGDEVVIVHGRAAVVPIDHLDRDLATALDEAYTAKYVDQETGEPLSLTDGPEGSAVYRVVPERVLGWLERDFLRSRTRWRFPT